MRSPLRILAALLVVAGFGTVGGGPASAADNGSFSLLPTVQGAASGGALDLRLAPGATARESVTLRNETGAAMVFDLYAADAFDDANGVFVLRGANESRRDVGAWVQLPVKHLTVPGRAVFAIPFTMHVPGNAMPGDHAGGIVALARPGSSPSASPAPGVGVRSGVGVRIYVRVRGQLAPSLRVDTIQYHPDRSWETLFGGMHSATVTYRVVNSGNVRLAPGAVVSVAATPGAKKGSVQLPELLPGGSVLVTANMGGIRGLGDETAKVVVTAAGASTSGTSSAFVFPWGLVVIAVLLVAVVIAWLWRRRSARSAQAAQARGERVDALQRAVDEASVSAPPRPR
jgi:hypothetical protein